MTTSILIIIFRRLVLIPVNFVIRFDTLIFLAEDGETEDWGEWEDWIEDGEGFGLWYRKRKCNNEACTGKTIQYRKLNGRRWGFGWGWSKIGVWYKGWGWNWLQEDADLDLAFEAKAQKPSAEWSTCFETPNVDKGFLDWWNWIRGNNWKLGQSSKDTLKRWSLKLKLKNILLARQTILWRLTGARAGGLLLEFPGNLVRGKTRKFTHRRFKWNIRHLPGRDMWETHHDRRHNFIKKWLRGGKGDLIKKTDKQSDDCTSEDNGKKHPMGKKKKHGKRRRKNKGRRHRKDHSKESMKDHSKDSGKDHSKDHGKHHSKDHGKHHSMDHGKHHSKDHGEHHSKDHGEHHSEDHGKHHSKDKGMKNKRDKKREKNRKKRSADNLSGIANPSINANFGDVDWNNLEFWNDNGPNFDPESEQCSYNMCALCELELVE